MYKHLQSQAVHICQVILISLLVLTSITVKVTWTSCLLLACLLLTWALPKLSKLLAFLCPEKVAFDLDFNPYKGKIGPGYLSDKMEEKIAQAISDYICYDASIAPCLERFKIKLKSECLFARRSKLWGSADYVEEYSLEENIRSIAPTFYKFTMAFQDLALDAFLLELPGQLYGQNVQVFGDAVMKVLLTLRKADLQRQRLHLLKTQSNQELLKAQFGYLQEEDPKKWSKMNWVFEFNKITFFITTFAPFYPETNSRYAFGLENCYVLFQPEIAFAIRDLPADTAETNWEHPVTVRDKIRVAFREAGREYEVPMKLHKPMVYDIVKKVYPEDEDILWWLSS